jgi:hypothetical protein
LDSLFGVDHHSSAVDHLADLSSILGNDDIGSDDIPSLKAILPSNVTALLDTPADTLVATSPDGSSSTLLPIAGAAPDPAHVSILGEATSMTPGHSIDFPAPVTSEGDVLFRGNSYTDYHVALQTVGPSSAANNLASTLSSATSTTPDTVSLAHVDSLAPNSPASSTTSPPAQHQDTSLAHVTSTLDDLSLRGHTH